MNQQLLFFTAKKSDPYEFINMTFARLAIALDFLKLFIQKLKAFAPVNQCCFIGEAEFHKQLEVQLECFFPGTVKINAFWFRHYLRIELGDILRSLLRGVAFLRRIMFTGFFW